MNQDWLYNFKEIIIFILRMKRKKRETTVLCSPDHQHIFKIKWLEWSHKGGKKKLFSKNKIGQVLKVSPPLLQQQVPQLI